ncbi:Dehydroquinase class I domain protein [Candidatus Magnetobacterium bavaricum]|uniref:3-dehydroquinate dehydratase n=1 Tax=Candidatus Magnetobacterium bavaricum TaxID=29290 RepID=A0A0F3GUM9_9BACT|nr:Dehydroquinase class I domain protein [Candidatus Magnetobacterium bavaricum]
MTVIGSVRIGALTLGERPAIAVPLTNVDVEVLDTLRGADIIELRIDMFDDPFNQQSIRDTFTKARQRWPQTPIIATCRSSNEGGFKLLTENDRFELINLVTPMTDAVDIEIHSPIAPEVIKLVKDAGKTLITSYHNFKRTPSLEELDAIIARCKGAGTHITKIAVMACSQSDMETMTRFTLNHNKEDIVTIVMGEFGMASRVFLPRIGSLFTFAGIETVSAPGQMSIQEVSKFLR